MEFGGSGVFQHLAQFEKAIVTRDNIENSVPPMQSIQTELPATVGLFAFFIPKQATQF